MAREIKTNVIVIDAIRFVIVWEPNMRECRVSSVLME